jgi:uncharacterized membrane protein YfcA
LIDWPVTAQFIAGGLLGGIAGTLLAKRLAAEKNVLERIFAVLILCVAAYILYRSAPSMLG